MPHRFDPLRAALSYIEPDQIAQIEKAYLVALEAHTGQMRASGEEYITHPLAVATILADMRMDQASIIAGVLHDTIEDTELTKKRIAELFDDTIAKLVDGLSKINKLEFSSRAEADAENFRKMLLAMSDDIRVIIVKLADRLHNMRTIAAVSRDTQRRKCQETLDVFAPIARRLGMHDLAIELESLSFKVLHPKRFSVLEQSLAKVQGDQGDLLEEIRLRMAESLDKLGIEIFEISVRQKALYSIYRKMRRKRISFSELTDLHAIRIVTNTVDDCYRALGVVHGMYKPVPDKFMDYIAQPKPNEYQSLHTVLFGPHGTPIEVQIRTQEMHQTAIGGVSAHWLYKSGGKANEAQIKAQTWIQGLIELQQIAGNAIDLFNNAKVDLFPEEVYVFTPKGTIMELPVGSTAIDFAYMVHTDLGNACVAAKIDQQLAPLSSVLLSGQTVEIITAPGARPSPSWLSFVATGKARSSIRHYLKTQQHEASVVLGQRLLDKALRTLNTTLADQKNAICDAVAESLQYQSFEQLLEDIGLGNRPAILVARNFLSEPLLSLAEEAQIDECEQGPLAITGAEGVVIDYAQCCQPLPGDAIVGVLNAGHGVMIHRDNCRRILRLSRQSEQCVPMCWADQVDGVFPVAIAVNVDNQRGALGMLALVVSDAGADIQDVEITAEDKLSPLVQFHISVRDRTHLAEVIKNIRRVPQVTRVWRFSQDV